MFLGSNDIQLGVNESLYDTSRVVSSMVDGIMARVGHHSEVEVSSFAFRGLSKRLTHSSALRRLSLSTPLSPSSTPSPTSTILHKSSPTCRPFSNCTALTRPTSPPSRVSLSHGSETRTTS